MGYHLITMKKSLLPLSVFAAFSIPSSLLAEEGKSIQLFNGKDLTGWHSDVPAADKDPKIKPSFIARDGKLVSLGKPGGHLITDKVYENFKLELEYRFAKNPGNCGVLVYSSTPRELYGMFPKSIEVQMHHQNAGDFWCIGENIEVPNMEARRPKREGQKYGGGPKDARRILNLTDDSEKPVGEWNKMVIECKGNELKVWVNGDMVNHGTNCTASKGQIALQAEGVEVEFKGLTLTPLAKK